MNSDGKTTQGNQALSEFLGRGVGGGLMKMFWDVFLFTTDTLSIPLTLPSLTTSRKAAATEPLNI